MGDLGVGSSLRFLEVVVDVVELFLLENAVMVVCFFFLWEEDGCGEVEDDLVFFFDLFFVR